MEARGFMSLDKVSIPNYSRKQENFNALSHALGLLIALFMFVFSVIKLMKAEITTLYFFGLLIFALSITLVYLVSAIYHYLNKDNIHKKLFRVLDHCTIYLLIAGTYTPICFTLFNVHIVGLVMLVIEWSGALLGIILNAFFFDKKATQITSFILYVVMGWLALYSGGFLYMDKFVFLFILLGGITYTIGSILYAFGHHHTSFHSIFHVFVLISTILQTIGIILLFK